MRLVIVNRDAPAAAGVLVASDGDVAQERDRFLNELSLKYYAPLYGVKWIRDSVRDRLMSAVDAAFEAGRLQATNTPEYTQVLGLQLLRGATLPEPEPFERECVSVGWDATFLAGHRFDARLFAGRFRSEAAFRAIVEADGRTSRIHIFRLDAAARVFQRHGGGTIEEGVYFLHPKRSAVLVPAAGYHSEMLREMVQEAHLALGQLGARTLTIETQRGVSFEGKVVAEKDDVKAGASTGGGTRSTSSVSYQWASPTFTPETALAGAAWIRDNSAVMSIVRQRQATNLVRFEEVATVDTSFAIDMSVADVFSAGMKWARQSTYRFVVEFFDKREAQ